MGVWEELSSSCGIAESHLSRPRACGPRDWGGGGGWGESRNGTRGLGWHQGAGWHVEAELRKFMKNSGEKGLFRESLVERLAVGAAGSVSQTCENWNYLSCFSTPRE